MSFLTRLASLCTISSGVSVASVHQLEEDDVVHCCRHDPVYWKSVQSKKPLTLFTHTTPRCVTQHPDFASTYLNAENLQQKFKQKSFNQNMKSPYRLVTLSFQNELHQSYILLSTSDTSTISIQYLS